MITAAFFLVGAAVGAVVSFAFVLWCDRLDRATRYDERIHPKYKLAPKHKRN